MNHNFIKSIQFNQNIIYQLIIKIMTILKIFVISILIIYLKAEAYKQELNTTTRVYIDAIFPCDIYFTKSSTPNTSGLINCSAYIPGNRLNSTTWQQCYFNCCPGFNTPATSTLDDIQPCFQQYQKRPALVIIIGVVILIIFVIAFFIVPLISTNEDLCSKCYSALFQSNEQEKQKMLASKQPQKLQVPKNQKGEFDFLGLGLHNIQKVLIGKEIIDDQHPQKRICNICNDGGSNLLLSCGHNFHTRCITFGQQSQQEQRIKECQQCKTKDIFPVRVYCWKCPTKYVHLNELQLSSKFICKACDE